MNDKPQGVQAVDIRIRIVLCIVFVSIGFAILGVNATTEPLPPNVRLTNAAWKAYDNGEYRQAIKKAEECIDEFQPSALREQKELERNNTVLPPVGKVGEAVKNVILNRGLLNDVATCWFIKGQSLERLGTIQEAIQAYSKAVRYTHARTYDPSWSGFWSPSQTASDRISYLKGNCE